jgi:3-oxoacyl-[acyl-carrier protein] reductase
MLKKYSHRRSKCSAGWTFSSITPASIIFCLSRRSRKRTFTGISTSTLGLLLATKEAAKLFGDEGGSVINIGSMASDLNPPNSVVYTATKGAVDAVTRVLAKELGPRKTRVNAINPGMIETEGTYAARVIGSDLEKQFVALTARADRTAGNIAPVAVFLASDESRWVTGDTLVVSGVTPL